MEVFYIITDIWRRRWDLNLGHIGGRRVLSQLRHPLLWKLFLFFFSFPSLNRWSTRLHLFTLSPLGISPKIAFEALCGYKKRKLTTKPFVGRCRAFRGSLIKMQHTVDVLRFNFVLGLNFLGMIIYDNEFETEENKIWTKDKIEPQRSRNRAP